MTCPVTKEHCERSLECFHAMRCLLQKAPRPLIDYAPPISTRAMRRRHVWMRCLQLTAAALLAWSAWSLVAGVLDFNDRRVETMERAARSGR